jgi:glycosyltransferase involved in cell wall biosynthesis
VVERHAAALRRAGVDVLVAEQSTDERERSLAYPAEAALTTATGRGRNPLRLARKFQPDIVHVHNLFPNFGRRWLYALDRPIVATMHNFRPLCPAATFYRDGRVCTDCLDKRSAVPSILHGCYRGSRVRTLPLAISTKFSADPLLDRADRLIVLSETMRRLYEDAGVSTSKICVIPNFLPDPGPPGPGGDAWLYVGRLSPEKGIREMIQAWPKGIRLKVAGDGPLRDTLASEAPDGVELIGSRTSKEVRQLMGASLGLAFPSRWFEGLPMVYLEALAMGTPVLAWRPSSVAELIEREGTGRVVTTLADDLATASQMFPSMRRACRSTFFSLYTEEKHVSALLELYESLTRGK